MKEARCFPAAVDALIMMDESHGWIHGNLGLFVTDILLGKQGMCVCTPLSETVFRLILMASMRLIGISVGSKNVLCSNQFKKLCVF